MVSPFPALSLSAFASFNDQKYTSLNTPAVLVASTAFPLNPKDVAFPYAPEVTYGANVRYQTDPLGVLGYAVLNLDYYHASRTYFSPFKTDKSLSQAPYQLLNARVDLVGVAGSQVTVSGYVKNITDEVYVVGGANTAATAGFNSFFYNEPRTYGLLINVKF